MSADEIQDIVDAGGQMFEDLGQSLRKVINSDGEIDPSKLDDIEHFWVFDGRLTSDIKGDMIDQFIDKLEKNDALLQTLKASVSPLADIDVDDVARVLTQMIRVNA